MLVYSIHDENVTTLNNIPTSHVQIKVKCLPQCRQGRNFLMKFIFQKDFRSNDFAEILQVP